MATPAKMPQNVANEYAAAVSKLSPATTELSPAEFNTAMKNWEEAARLHNGVGPDYDYGLAANLTRGKNGHIGDIGKLPNHPTFSVESAYSAPDVPGGVWKNNSFYASPQNLIYTSKGRLQNYFNRVEPGVTLVLPKAY